MFKTKSLKRIPKIPIDPTEIHPTVWPKNVDTAQYKTNGRTIWGNVSSNVFELKAFEFPMAFLNEFKSILTFVNAPAHKVKYELTPRLNNPHDKTAIMWYDPKKP